MFVALDALLIVITALSLLIGLTRRWSFWRSRQDTAETGDWAYLLAYLFTHRQIGRKRLTGLAHLVLVLGFILFSAVVFLNQVDGLLSALQAAVVSFVLDLTGLLMLAATGYFLGKKLYRRVKPAEHAMKKRSLVTLVLLLLILLTGFWAEGTRLAIGQLRFDTTAPLGSLFALLTTDSPLLMQVFIRVHIYLVLIFIATLPYGYMRHIASSAMNVLHRTEKRVYPAPRLSEINLAEPAAGPENQTDPQPVEALGWRSLLALEACVSCGRCTENCPAAISGKPLLPGEMVQRVFAATGQAAIKSLSPVTFEAAIAVETAWSCTNCLACIEHCPVYVRPMDLINIMRRHLVLARAEMPEAARPMIWNLEMYKDTMGRGASRREAWTVGLNVARIEAGGPATEYLIWTGCAGAFHPRNSETTRALVKILKAAKADFKILGQREMCCGDPARRLGDEDLFLKLARENIDQLQALNFKRIITTCPHCYHTLKNDYAQLGGDFTVQHASETVAGLMADGKIRLKYPVADGRITHHDPCYLGRAAGIFEVPRRILGALSGVSVKEMRRNRESAFCCGAGGGCMWLHETQGTGINRIRSQEVLETAVDRVTVSCPYCLTMLEDGLGGLESETRPKVSDLIELVAEAIG